VLSLKLFSNQFELASLDDARGAPPPASPRLEPRPGHQRPARRHPRHPAGGRAALLGYASHAAYVVADRTPGAPQRPSPTCLARLVPPAVANAEREARALARGGRRPRRGVGLVVYSEKVRKERYDIDEAALRPYFVLDKVLYDVCLPPPRTSVYGLTSPSARDCPATTPTLRSSSARRRRQRARALLADFFARAPSAAGRG